MIKYDVKKCFKTKGKKCRIPDMLVIGQNHWEAMEHISDAQRGEGSNGVFISPLLHYTHKPASKDGWYRKKRFTECWKKTGKHSPAGKNLDCDEYPFVKTREGGESRYNQLRVSLRPIDRGDNRGAGTVFAHMIIRGGRMRHGKAFLVVPSALTPKSFYMRDFKFGF